MTYLVYKYTDNGLSRVVYQDSKSKHYYCLQDRGVARIVRMQLFACTKDGEPSHPVRISKFIVSSSPGKSYIDNQINLYLRKLDNEARINSKIC